MTDWGTLPLAVELTAAQKLLDENGMHRAAQRLRLKGKAKEKRGGSIKVKLSNGSPATLSREAVEKLSRAVSNG